MSNNKRKLQDLFAFPLTNLEKYSEIRWEVCEQGNIVKKGYFESNQFLAVGDLFQAVEIRVFKNGSYNISFKGSSSNYRGETKELKSFINALYILFGKDAEGNKRLDPKDWGKMHSVYSKEWGNDVSFSIMLGEAELTLFGSAIERVKNKTFSIADTLKTPVKWGKGCLTTLLLFAILLLGFFAILYYGA